MRRWATLVLAAATATALAAAGKQSGTLESAIAALGAYPITRSSTPGSGKWYLFGQEPNPRPPASGIHVSSYIATIDYLRATKRVQMARNETVDPTASASRRTKRGRRVRGRRRFLDHRASRRSGNRLARDQRAGREKRRGARDGNLGDPAGFPEGRRGEPCHFHAHHRRRLRSDFHGSGSTNMSARSTRRTRSRRSTPGSTIPSWATCFAKPHSPTIATSAA